MLSSYFNTRLGRLQYFIGNVLVTVPFIIILIFYLIVFSPGEDDSELFSSFLDLIIFILVVPLVIRRFHDLGKSGWYILTLIVPLVNIYFIVELLFRPGKPELNKWGAPSEKFWQGILMPFKEHQRDPQVFQAQMSNMSQMPSAPQKDSIPDQQIPQAPVR